MATPWKGIKSVLHISPLLVDAGTATAVALDTAGYNSVSIQVIVGATDVALTALKLTECATSGGSYTDVSDGGFASADLPSATDDGGIYEFRINPLNTERYLKVVATAADGTLGANIAAIALLGGQVKTPLSDTERGITDSVEV